jgi:hypothetical protein
VPALHVEETVRIDVACRFGACCISLAVVEPLPLMLPPVLVLDGEVLPVVPVPLLLVVPIPVRPVLPEPVLPVELALPELPIELDPRPPSTRPITSTC